MLAFLCSKNNFHFSCAGRVLCTITSSINLKNFIVLRIKLVAGEYDTSEEHSRPHEEDSRTRSPTQVYGAWQQ